MVPRFQKCKKKNVEIFLQNVSRFWDFGALFIVKQRFLNLTFLKKGWLGFTHIRSTCGPDLPRARHTLRVDAPFRQGLPQKKVRCASAYDAISPSGSGAYATRDHRAVTETQEGQ